MKNNEAHRRSSSMTVMTAKSITEVPWTCNNHASILTDIHQAQLKEIILKETRFLYEDGYAYKINES